MALNRKVNFEVRGLTGDDTNGGGFDAVSGVPGTDYSQQASPQITYTDLAIQATTTQLRSAGNPFTAAHVGNIINVTGGAGFTTGRYQVISVSGITATMDRTVGTASSTGGTGKLGGCLATIQGAIDAMTVADMKTWIKADGTYTLTSGLTTAGSPGGSGIYQHRMIGYATTRGDGGQVSITTASAIVMLAISTASGWSWENFDFNGAGVATQGVVVTNSYSKMWNCRIRNMVGEGWKASSPFNQIVFCEVTGCGGTSGAVDCGISTIQIIGCYIHDNTASGVSNFGSNRAELLDTISANNSGASSDGVSIRSLCTIKNCLFYGNGRDGMRSLVAGDANSLNIVNNLCVKNAGYGFNFLVAGNWVDMPYIDYNGYWSNTSGARNNLTAGPHDVDIAGSDPTNDPFIDKAGSDWRLNNTAGAGALLRAAGWPASWPQLSGVANAIDIGPYQRGGPIFQHPGMTGGFNG